MKIRSKHLLWGLIIVYSSVGCHYQRSSSAQETESMQAKNLLQGIWIDTETDEVAIRVKGDTIYYPDSINQPAYFRVIGDTIELGRNHYYVVKQSENIFWFRNLTGDVVKLRKSDDPNDVLSFVQEKPDQYVATNEVIKTDSVVMYKGERYHWYIAINPTRYRVSKTSYSDDAIEVENMYYDNIINIGVFKGAQKLYSKDIKKQMYLDCVPESFLSQAILGDMKFDRVDDYGFHFNATLCIPDGASCYLISTDVGFDGNLTMKLLEY